MFRVRVAKKNLSGHGIKSEMGMQKENESCRDIGCKKYFVWVMAEEKWYV